MDGWGVWEWEDQVGRGGKEDKGVIIGRDS